MLSFLCKLQLTYRRSEPLRLPSFRLAKHFRIYEDKLTFSIDVMRSAMAIDRMLILHHRQFSPRGTFVVHKLQMGNILTLNLSPMCAIVHYYSAYNQHPRGSCGYLMIAKMTWLLHSFEFYHYLRMEWLLGPHSLM